MIEPRDPEQLRDFRGQLLGNPSLLEGVQKLCGSPAKPTAWPEPQPLGDDLLPVPAFNLAILPEAFQGHVVDMAERMQVPVDLPAVCAILCLAGCVGRRATIQPKRADTGWIVTPNIYGGIIAPPSQMKSPTLGAFTEHLVRIESEWRAEYETEAQAFESWEQEHELRLQAWREAYKATFKRGNVPAACPQEDREKPILRRLVVNDPTIEVLHVILSENPAGVLLVRDELSGWLAALDKPGHENDRQFYLEAWNGDKSFTVDRIGRGSIHVPNVCLSVVGGIQPGRLRQYLVDAVKDGPGNDGLFQRLQMLTWPDFPKSWKLIDRRPNQTAAERVALVYRRLAALPAEEPQRLIFSDEAQELFYAWWTKLEGKVRGGDLHTALVAHLSKYRKLMPALALLFELADSENPATAVEVNLAHAAKAAEWCEYLEAHAKRIYGCIVSPELHAARELADKIRREKLLAEFFQGDSRASVFGVFNWVAGVAAFPASFLAGWIWQRYSPAAPFALSSLLAFVAGVLLLFA